jgi:hypothetical protein
VRGYLFTRLDRVRLERWLESGAEDRGTQVLFVQVRRSLDRLVRDVEEAAGRVRASFTLRRLRIDPGRKRGEYLLRLEALKAELDSVTSDPRGVEKVQLRAMDVLVRVVRMCYRMVVDVDVERLEFELETLKEESRRAEEARGELGYRVEGQGSSRP